MRPTSCAVMSRAFWLTTRRRTRPRPDRSADEPPRPQSHAGRLALEDVCCTGADRGPAGQLRRLPAEAQESRDTAGVGVGTNIASDKHASTETGALPRPPLSN